MPNDDAYLIGTDDGTLFRCFVEPVGADHQLRWIFETKRTRYLGPDARIAATLDEVEAMVREWWATKKALGQYYG